MGRQNSSSANPRDFAIAVISKGLSLSTKKVEKFYTADNLDNYGNDDPNNYNENSNNNNDGYARNAPGKEFNPDEEFFDHDFQPLDKRPRKNDLSPRTFFDDFRGFENV